MLHPESVQPCGRRAFTERAGLSRLFLVLPVLLILGLGFPTPSRACTEPPLSADIWIQIQDGHFWIIIRGFHTFGASSGFLCGCGLKRVPSISQIERAEVIDSATQQPLPGFSVFTPNAGTTQSLQAAEPGPWQGLSSPITQEIPGGRAVEISIHGLLSSGATFNSLASELRQAFRPFGAGKADPSTGGIPNIAFIDDIQHADPTTSSAGAPVVQVARVTAGPSGAVEVSIRDAGLGLSLITASAARNATAQVAAFSQGTREPVNVNVALRDDGSPGAVEVKACNVLGRCATSELALMAMELGDRPVIQQTMQIDAAQSRFFFQNGDPGVRMLTLSAGGRKFSVRPLESGQVLEGDLSAALSSGSNVLTCTARGTAQARGLLVLSSTP